MHIRLFRWLTVLALVAGVGSSANADQYFLMNTSVSNLIERCKTEVAPDTNVLCLEGRFHNNPVQEAWFKAVQSAGRNRDVTTLNDLKLRGLPVEFQSHYYYAFLSFAEIEYSELKVPMVTAELRIYKVEIAAPLWQQNEIPSEVQDYVQAALKPLGLIRGGSEEGRAIKQAIKQKVEVSQKSEAMQAAQKNLSTRPKCSTVSFSAYIAGSGPSDLSVLNEAKDKKEMVARYPLRCSPSAITQTYACAGAAYLSAKLAYIIGWNADMFQVATPVDLIRGRKDAIVYVNRKEITCLDNTPPMLDFSENLLNFIKNHSKYR